MASLPIKLDSFPAEIIQRIASFSSCESVLALLKVNRQLHRTCNDALVFRAIIRNGNGNEVSKAWDCDLISQSKSTSVLSRLALADSRARVWLQTIENYRLKEEPRLNHGRLWDLESPWQAEEGGSSEHDTSHMKPKNMLKWAPQLVALHHPFITEGPMYRVITQFRVGLMSGNTTHDREEDMARKFCIAATILHEGSAAMHDGSRTTQQIHQGFQGLIDSFPPSSHAPDIPVRLACALLCHRGAAVRQLPPPSPYKIPFQSIFRVPMPFSGDEFVTQGHLSVMTSVSFLESGEWVGYYTYSMDLDRTRFDPPMTGIQFVADPKLGPHGVHAHGVDNVGSFTLNGTIGADGVVKMTKSYAQGFSWNWTAAMTPFGIVGFWGGGNVPHGRFWLWKREWS